MFSSVIFWCESCCPTLIIIALGVLVFFSLGSHFVLDSGSGMLLGKPGGCCHFQNQKSKSLLSKHTPRHHVGLFVLGFGFVSRAPSLHELLVIFRSRNTLKVTDLKGLSLPPQFYWNAPKSSFPEVWCCCTSAGALVFSQCFAL